jgi:glycosyltransferase involved in cell wall biosynthesis
MIVDIIIPAYNEEGTVGRVVGDVRSEHVRQIIVVDNNSTDDTARVAEEAGAVVLRESRRGYGAACLEGIRHVNQMEQLADVVAFLDGDYSDHPEELDDVLAPIIEGRAEMVIGSRALGNREAGSMTPQQRFGNWLASVLIVTLYGVKFTDLGPFRTITLPSLNVLDMQDKTYGWTVEMQVKGIKHGLRIVEVPVNYRKRGAGKSKVAGTLKGTIFAGYKIIKTILKYR